MVSTPLMISRWMWSSPSKDLFLKGKFKRAAIRSLKLSMRGTGMIASSSIFRPHPGRAIRDLFRQLHAVRHGMGANIQGGTEAIIQGKLQPPRIWP